jgi:hypothetical protein
MKLLAAIALVLGFAAEARAQETAWPDPAPTECLAAAFHDSVIFERLFARVDDISSLKTTGNTPRDCQRIFHWVELETAPTLAVVEAYTLFANDLLAERRKERRFATSPIGCLQASFVRLGHARLPSQASCESAGYWVGFKGPDTDKQAERRAAFAAAVLGELG